ncbi:LysR substrate-binding domain-containing protein [Phyllobacterium zundukense]|uniref:LysR family transcriptional regulator n=1 Tax=Phyllobacterium zundukense TaxID=1867719 RepID=A0A2N9VQK1_9HYPH|nr:LysR substrate-binding domain-containing protein [Phyllobacterium zundukense]ATU94244.1 LysR family transcriptional regulator [Phyllobacterium zundukense]PIO41769.1 LysR family transcriptional regulator [Phyllobacterium zundukense]
MVRENVSDLMAFIAVAQEGSFTRAAVRLGVSQPALSKTIRTLEERLGLRLLSRTTRSVAPTEAGERLLRSIEPHFAGIEGSLSALTELRDKPSGIVRITATQHAADTVMWPRLAKVMLNYPDITVELVSDEGLANIVSERFDAGVRVGEYVEKDMIAVRIGPPMRQAIVASPGYFKERPAPKHPEELTGHRCINLRRVTRGGYFPWEFEKRGREINVRVEGQLAVTSLELARRAALDGLGVAYLPDDMVQDDLTKKRLVRVLEDWCEPFPGYHLYYPSSRQHAPAFAVVLEALRFRG